MSKYISTLMLVIFLYSSNTLAGQCEDLAKPTVLNKDTAMQAVFCHYDTSRGGTLIPLRYTQSWNIQKARTLASPLIVQTYSEGNVEKGVLVVQRQSLIDGELEISHAAGAILSVYIFEFDGTKWIFERGKKHVAEAGTHGNAPNGKLAKLGDDRYGIIFQGGFTGQGYTELYAFIISLSEPNIAKIGSFDTGKSNSGACSDDPAEQKKYHLSACWDYQGKIELINRKGADYYLLRISYEGTHESDYNDRNRIILKNIKQCFIKQNNYYYGLKDPMCAEYPALPIIGK